MSAVRTLIQTEEVMPGDVIPHWTIKEEPATVTAVEKYRDRVVVYCDRLPSRRYYRPGRGMTVLR